MQPDPRGAVSPPRVAFRHKAAGQRADRPARPATAGAGAGAGAGGSSETGGTVVLSPHADDAAFSLGAVLRNGLLPRPVSVVTVFGRTDFAAERGPIVEVSRRRADEDRSFCDFVGAQLSTRELEDACVRHPGLAIAELFNRDAQDSADLAAGRRVREVVEHVIAQRRPSRVLAPIGLGGHVDHRLVREAALATARAVWLYADLPYALPNDMPAADQDARLVVHGDRATIAVKERCARHYPSQPAAAALVRLLRAVPDGAPVEMIVAA